MENGVTDSTADKGGKELADLRERLAELETEREETRFVKAAVEAQTDTFFVFDPDTGKAIRWNQAFSDISGYSDAEIAAMKAPDSWYSESDLEKASHVIPMATETERATVELDLITKSGRRVPTEYSASLVYDDSGRMFIVSVGRDISDRKNMQQALEKRLLALTQPLPDSAGIAFEELFDLNDIQRLQDEFAAATGVASIITNTDGTPITKPSNFCHLCKNIIRKTEVGLRNCYRSDAVLGQPNPCGPTVQPCMSGGLWDAGSAISVGGKHIANWLIGQVRDAAQTEENMRKYARDIDADEESLVAAFRDVPSMTREQFDSIAQVLFTLANQLSSMAYQNVQQARFITEQHESREKEKALLERLARSEKMESLGLLAGGVAHDLNNVLGPLVALPDIIRDEVEGLLPPGSGLNEETSEALDMMGSCAQRAASVVKDLVGISRQGRFDLAPLNLLELPCLRSSTPFLTNVMVDNPGVSIRHETANLPLVVMGAHDHLDRVNENLILNAAQAISGNGTVTIGLRKEVLSETHEGVEPIPAGEYAVITVADDGDGIAADDLGRIFEPFFTRKKKSERSGSGLGLSVVHGVVEAHKGYIDVASRLGSGTVFSIYLPLLEAPVPAKELKGAAASAEGVESILIVDDEPGQRMIAGRIMRRQGYTIAEAESGRDALRVLGDEGEGATGESPFALILLDMIMEEGFDGLDTLTVILDRFPRQRVLIASGHAENERVSAALQLGASWIPKPYSVADLASAVRTKLDA